MKQMLILAGVVILGAFGTARTQAAQSNQPLAEYFKGYDGTFVLLDTKTGKYTRYNETRAHQRLSPCSTFKIFNSLVGLETGVLTGKTHTMKWDGTKYDIDAWNKDQDLQSAISNSVVWYFQRVAQGIGQERMDKYIKLVHYGNEDTSGGLTKFWLGTSLKISADEQVRFLKRLHDNDLPFSAKTIATVKEITSLETTDKGTLHGKTGTDGKGSENVFGWFVGYVEQPNDTYIFATNISAPKGAYGKKARQITEKILKDQGIL